MNSKIYFDCDFLPENYKEITSLSPFSDIFNLTFSATYCYVNEIIQTNGTLAKSTKLFDHPF